MLYILSPLITYLYRFRNVPSLKLDVLAAAPQPPPHIFFCIFLLWPKFICMCCSTKLLIIHHFTKQKLQPIPNFRRHVAHAWCCCWCCCCTIHHYRKPHSKLNQTRTYKYTFIVTLDCLFKFMILDSLIDVIRYVPVPVMCVFSILEYNIR